jgi:hypothetical protein
MDFAQSVATIFGVLNLAPKRKIAPILISPQCGDHEQHLRRARHSVTPIGLRSQSYRYQLRIWRAEPDPPQ